MGGGWRAKRESTKAWEGHTATKSHYVLMFLLWITSANHTATEHPKVKPYSILYNFKIPITYSVRHKLPPVENMVTFGSQTNTWAVIMVCCWVWLWDDTVCMWVRISRGKPLAAAVLLAFGTDIYCLRQPSVFIQACIISGVHEASVLSRHILSKDPDLGIKITKGEEVQRVLEAKSEAVAVQCSAHH